MSREGRAQVETGRAHIHPDAATLFGARHRLSMQAFDCVMTKDGKLFGQNISEALLSENISNFEDLVL